MSRLHHARECVVSVFLIGASMCAARVVISKTQIASLLGSDKTGRLVYVNKSDSRAYFIDFGASSFEAKRLSSLANVSSPMLSPDGRYFAFAIDNVRSKGNCSDGYNTAETYLCKLEESSTPRKVANGFDPRFWQDPNSGKMYLVYRTGYCKARWPDQPGETYKLEVDLSSLSKAGDPIRVYAKGFGGGLSKSGRFQWGLPCLPDQDE
ncbi:MAG: hypothetical protein GF398_02010 [Chitinivibrionales bacterium]|nr:hypothetical protein [Chitinivibrionales bacterium]